MPGGERLGGAEPRDRDHVRRASSLRLRLMCVASQSPNGRAVAEARVDGVLEVRVRVDEPRQDHRVVVVALALVRGRPRRSGRPPTRRSRSRPAGRRPGRPSRRRPPGHVSNAGFSRGRSGGRGTRRAMIEPSKSTKSGTAWSVVVTGSTLGRDRHADDAAGEVAHPAVLAELVGRHDPEPRQRRPGTRAARRRRSSRASTCTQKPRYGFACRMLLNWPSSKLVRNLQRVRQDDEVAERDAADREDAAEQRRAT